MYLAAHRYAWLAVIFIVCLRAAAQQTALPTNGTQPAAQNLEQVPRVPGLNTLFRGLNAGITYSGIHSSSIGWYELATPAVSYTISSHYSIDASTLIYLHRLVQNLNSQPQSSQRLALDIGDTGDTFIGLHGAYHPHLFDDTVTVSLTAPTGDRSAGLGTGRVTFDFNNLAERYVRQTGFLVNLGIGDSSSLANNLLTQNYNSLGKLGHFQAGVIFWPMRRYYLQSIAYEELPLGSQTVYTILSPPNGNGSGQPGGAGSNVVTSTSASEDNGFLTQAGIPLTAHLTLSGYYDRSLRQHLDTVSIGMTFVLRGRPIPARLSLIDRALREAAGISGK